MERTSVGLALRRCRFAVALVLAVPVTAASDASTAPPTGSATDASTRWPAWSISGEQRTRYERLDAQFRPALDSADDVLALRTSVRLSADWPGWHVHAELMDSRAELNDSGSVINGTIVNTLEPLQLTATRSWRDALGKGSTTSVRAGRMTFDLGTRRVIARNAYRNTINSFLGAEWHWQRGNGSAARVFHLVPMDVLPASRSAMLDNDQRLDRSARHTRLRGVYYHFRELIEGHRAELYWLGLDANEAAGRRDLRTVGIHFYRPEQQARWHYDIEAILQSGESAGAVAGEWRNGLAHAADFFHVDVGYSFAPRWAPVLTVRYDRASGDDDPDDLRNERFDTLYGARRFDFGPTGIYGPFARANIESLGIRGTVRLAPRWRAMTSYRAFELASARDAWTTTGLRDESGAGDALGRQLEASFNWSAIEERLELEAGAAYFTKGSFVDTTAPELTEAAKYFYLELRTLF
jgi:hypothetical protein